MRLDEPLYGEREAVGDVEILYGEHIMQRMFGSYNSISDNSSNSDLILPYNFPRHARLLMKANFLKCLGVKGFETFY